MDDRLIVRRPSVTLPVTCVILVRDADRQRYTNYSHPAAAAAAAAEFHVFCMSGGITPFIAQP